MRCWPLLALCACRIGFDAVDPDASAAADDGGDGGGTITTITFGERPTSMRKNVTSDARLDQLQPALNYGGSEDLALSQFTTNNEHSLVRFELSSVPPGTAVTGARLQVHLLDYGDETAGTIVVRLLAETWIEGTNMGSPGGGVSWTTRDGSTPWTTPGGTTSRTLASLVMPEQQLVVPLEPDVVQSWIDDPASNAGVLLTVSAAPAHYHLHSRDSNLMQMTARPELAVDLIE